MVQLIRKIQNLSERERKIIFWILIIFFGFTLFFAWVQGLKQRLEVTKGQKIFEQLKPPKFEEQLKTLPKIEVPQFPELSEEELKKLEEELKKMEEQTKTE